MLGSLEEITRAKDVIIGTNLPDFDRGYALIRPAIPKGLPLEAMLTLQKEAVRHDAWRVAYAINLELIRHLAVTGAETKDTIPEKNTAERARCMINVYGELLGAGLVSHEEKIRSDYSHTGFGTLITATFVAARRAYTRKQLNPETYLFDIPIISDEEYIFVIEKAKELILDYVDHWIKTTPTDEETQRKKDMIQEIPEEEFPVSDKLKDATPSMPDDLRRHMAKFTVQLLLGIRDNHEESVRRAAMVRLDLLRHYAFAKELYLTKREGEATTTGEKREIYFSLMKNCLMNAQVSNRGAGINISHMELDKAKGYAQKLAESGHGADAWIDIAGELENLARQGFSSLDEMPLREIILEAYDNAATHDGTRGLFMKGQFAESQGLMKLAEKCYTASAKAEGSATFGDRARERLKELLR